MILFPGNAKFDFKGGEGWIQIICARLKILAMPPGRGVNQGANPPEGEVDPGADLAPCILKGTWEAGIHQQQFWKRLRYSLFPPQIIVCRIDGSTALT